MGLFRFCFYGMLVTGTLVSLHFSENENFAAVRSHPLYVDFVTPVMNQVQLHGEPLLRTALQHPAHKSELGESTTQAAPKIDSEKAVEKSKNLSNSFSMPSQMEFSMAKSGKGLSKRSVLSTEASNESSFDLPDGSRLWLMRDSVVEVAWANKNEASPQLLIRVERGMMHVERLADSKGHLFLITNSGIRHELAPRDAWMATAQMGVADKKQFPDADQKTTGRYRDYVRRATLTEARELSELLKVDGRREEMLYQDQLRLAADDEEVRRKRRENSAGVPFEVAKIPLEIPTRRGGKDLARNAGRSPASVALVSRGKFPARGPASASSLDEGTRMASETQISKWTDKGQCPEARKFFTKLREEHSLPDSDAWTYRMNQKLAQRCP